MDGDHATLSQRAEAAILSVFHVMTEKKTSHLTSTRPGKLLVLTLIDFWQLMGLTAAGAFGWDNPVASLLTFSFVEHFIPDDWGFVIAAYVGVNILAWMSILDAAYVSVAFANNQYNRLWPLKLLRVLVTTLVTVFFIPSLQVLLIPLDCGELRETINREDFSCSIATGLTGLSCVTMAVFVPFALGTSLMNFRMNPYSDGPGSKSTGRVAFLHTLSRVLLVASQFWRREQGHPNNILITAFFTAVCVGMMCANTIVQPSHRPIVNQLNTGLYGAAAGGALGSLLLNTGTYGVDTRQILSGVGMALMLVMAGVGYQLPKLYQASLRRRAVALLGLVSKKEKGEETTTTAGSEDRHEATAADAEKPPKSGRVAPTLPSESKEPSPRETETETETGTDGTTFFAGLTDALFKPAAYANRPPIKLFYFESDVELMARQILLIPHFETVRDALVSVPEEDERRRVDLAPADAITAASHVYRMGLNHFPASPKVRLFYSSFLQHYSRDLSRATAMMQTVDRYQPPIDLRFVLSSKSRSLEQERQSENLGSRNLDTIGMLAFRRNHAQALKHHLEATRVATTIWQGLYSNRGSDEEVRTNLSQFVAAKTAGSAAYDKLLREHPNAEVVLRSYARFARDVLNDPGLEKAYVKRADNLLNPHGADKNDRVENVGRRSTHSSGMSSATDGGNPHTRRHLRPKQNSVNVLRSMHWRLRLGLLVLLVTIVGAYIYVNQRSSMTLEVVQAVAKLGLLRKLFVQSMFNTRSLFLASNDEELQPYRAEAVATAELFHNRLHYAYFDVQPLASMDEVDIDIDRYYAGPPPRHEADQMSRWEIGNAYSSALLKLTWSDAKDLVGSALAQDTTYRFLVDNYNNGLNAFKAYIVNYRENSYAQGDETLMIEYVFLIVTTTTIVYLGGIEFMRALLQVHKSQKGITFIRQVVPRRVVKSLLAETTAREAALVALDEKMNHADESESESEREGDFEGYEEAVLDYGKRANTFLDVYGGADDDDDDDSTDGEEGEEKALCDDDRRSETKVAVVASGHVVVKAGKAGTPRRRRSSAASSFSKSKPRALIKARVAPSGPPPTSGTSSSDDDDDDEEGIVSLLKPSAASMIPGVPPSNPLASDSESESKHTHGPGRRHATTPPPSQPPAPPHPQIEDGRQSRQSRQSVQSVETVKSTESEDATSATAAAAAAAAKQGKSVLPRRTSVTRFSDTVEVNGQSVSLRENVTDAVVPTDSGALPHRARRKQSFHQNKLRRSSLKPSTPVEEPSKSCWQRLVANLTAIRSLSKQLKVLSVRLWVCFACLLAFQVIVTEVSKSAIMESQQGVTIADYTGQLRMLTQYTVTLSRELLVNDGEVMTMPEAVSTLRNVLDRTRKVQRALLFGDDDFGLKGSFTQDGHAGLTTIRQEPDPSVYDLSLNQTQHEAVLKLGLNDQLDTFLRLGGEMLARFDQWVNGTEPSTDWDPAVSCVTGQNLTLVLQDSHYEPMLNLYSGMGQKIGDGVTQTVAAFNRDMDSGKKTQLILLIANVAIVVLVEVGMLRLVFQRLRRDAQHTENLLELLPTEAVKSIPELKDMYELR